MEQIKAKARQLTTDQILEGITFIGGRSNVSIEERMVRAALIDVYAEREGDEAADFVMDKIGL